MKFEPFFIPHKEHKIGIKRLSDADIGQRNTSRQTHIGLMQDVLTYLPNTEVQAYSMFIFGDKCEMLKCYFDRIQNPNGTYRSPKIRMGAENSVAADSVVSRIREITATNTKSNWYLLWLGLEGDELAFWLFNDESKEFKLIDKMVKIGEHTIIDDNNIKFLNVLDIIVKQLNTVTKTLLPDLEIASQTISHKQFNPFDIEKAKKHFANVGRKGEELINNYLSKQVKLGKIHDFRWMNKSRESALPFDFIINTENEDDLFMDVKSTQCSFAQPLVFSSQEVDFAKEAKMYNVYRVYEIDINEYNANLKICNDCNTYMKDIGDQLDAFRNSIEEKLATQFRGASFAIEPTEKIFKQITNPIQLKQ